MANDFNTEKPKRRTRKKGLASDNSGLEQKRGKEVLEKSLEKSEAEKAAILEKLGGVVHEFNNILATIIVYTELAMNDLQMGNVVKVNDLQQIIQAAERAKNLVQEVLPVLKR